MDMDDLEIDPAIAEAMGFTSFGSKRRKHTARADDAFIDDSGTQIPASTGANDIPLGARPISNVIPEKVQEQGNTDDIAASTASVQDAQEEQQPCKRCKWITGLLVSRLLKSFLHSDGVSRMRGVIWLSLCRRLSRILGRDLVERLLWIQVSALSNG
jgi:hypothetical protein